MIRALTAILFCSRKAIVATAADPACETHADKLSDFDVVTYPWPECDDSAYAFVAADVWELDV